MPLANPCVRCNTNPAFGRFRVKNTYTSDLCLDCARLTRETHPIELLEQYGPGVAPEPEATEPEGEGESGDEPPASEPAAEDSPPEPEAAGEEPDAGVKPKRKRRKRRAV